MRVASSMLLASVLAAAACGGSTSGNGNSGGTAGSGGSATGGTSAGGSSAGGTSAGGSGGSSATGGSGNVSGLTACSGPGTCALFASNCCGGYCDPNAPLSGFLPVNKAKVSELEGQLCTGDIACPGCASMDNPGYLSLCRAGQCAAVDLRKDSLSACTSHDDCRVRWGSSCCENCNGGDTAELIAYNKSISLEAEICDPNVGACPPCAPPPYPKYILPLCGVDGHCTWTVVGP